MEIIELSHRPDLTEPAINYFWKCWGNDANFNFYRDCILNSLDQEKSLPKFYLLLDNGEIVGSYALLTNDVISRQDLMPWLACLFVNEEYRNQGLAGQLLEHSRQEAQRKGFDHLYLTTDLVDFYERKGWAHLCNGFGVMGHEGKIYSISLS